jgi:hypothetical protein
LSDKILVKAGDTAIKIKIKLIANVSSILVSFYVMVLLFQFLMSQFSVLSILYVVSHALLIVILSFTFFSNIRFMQRARKTSQTNFIASKKTLAATSTRCAAFRAKFGS